MKNSVIFANHLESNAIKYIWRQEDDLYFIKKLYWNHYVNINVTCIFPSNDILNVYLVLGVIPPLIYLNDYIINLCEKINSEGMFQLFLEEETVLIFGGQIALKDSVVGSASFLIELLCDYIKKMYPELKKSGLITEIKEINDYANLGLISNTKKQDLVEKLKELGLVNNV